MNIIANVLRGALIGMAELVPGISGGTIALVTGVYERVLHAANQFLDALKLTVKDRSAGIQRFKAVDWKLLLPMAVGMVLVVVTMAGIMESFVTNHEVLSRALFFGMVLVSLMVPIQMIDRADARRRLPLLIILFLIGAAATFFLTGVTSAPQENPNMIVVFFAAAVAICALVLPGISGSFFLLAVGLYSATMGAVHDRDLGYIAIFALGALTGIILFVRILGKLLTDHRTVTLVIMAGLMFGSLRALWPWQDGEANLLAPGDQLGAAIGLFVVGAAAVAAMVFTENRFSSRQKQN